MLGSKSYFFAAVSYTSKLFIKSTKVKSKVNFSFLGGGGYTLPREYTLRGKAQYS